MFSIYNNFYNTYDIYALSAAARYDVNVDAMVIQALGRSLALCRGPGRGP
jgi:hypothetical protein